MQKAQDVGIIAMDIYFPKTTVNQSELEVFDRVRKGKYTVGLGQNNMSVVGDREDIVSISMTAVKNFFERFSVSPDDIGRLEVGTETSLDKAKSVKSFLMTLFENNHNVEGVDSLNACYGGTSALFNAVNWIESKSWDGRLALVVASDIAVYAPGPARATGGVAAVVMLIGPNAPIVLESQLRGSHMEHQYDFYKPLVDVEYPSVDGKLSIQCYLKSLDNTYDIYSRKFREIFGIPFSLDYVDYFVFHVPFVKMVRKSFARMMFNDFLNNPSDPRYASVMKFKNLKREESYFHRSLENSFMNLGGELYKSKVEPTTMLATELGNTYCASLFMALLSLINAKLDDLVNKRILFFAYGSGMTSTMYSVKVTKPVSYIVHKINLQFRLKQRKWLKPKKFATILALREVQYRLTDRGYSPNGTTTDFYPGTYYLERIDEQHRRYYKRFSDSCQQSAKL
eukprot:TRINITY_DN4087_c0_g1_i2.p1 TRINITY_DN4087_c0_g1~~TRINITY_DN4087_c0_g1_i2.p1  ORF type:complete len:454 (-),score=77.14 TRINITY_DN4087_c0_g1_i2:143-1504(-)